MGILSEIILFIIFVFLGAIHIYWVLGGKWALDTAIPRNEKGETLFKPNKLATLVVAFCLFLFGLFYLYKANLIPIVIPDPFSTYMSWIIPGVFLLRAIGDFKYSGLFKKVRETKFGKKDTQVFTPICIFIGILGLITIL